MSRRVWFGVFENEADILGATQAARKFGLKIIDAYTPYAVHGLDEAMGLPPTRLPVVCFVAAAVGAILKLWFEFWTAVVDWPLNIGGKPWNSLPAFVPVTFEVMVLSAGLTTVFAFIVISRLRPWREPRLAHPRVTDDRFVLALEQSDAAFDVKRVRRLLEAFHVLEIEERVLEDARA